MFRQENQNWWDKYLNGRDSNNYDRTTDLSDGKVGYTSGSSERHRGVFSEDNPYLSQLAVHTNQADGDALYELAVKWEADRAALLEQRAYDDPMSQVARQRAAGINPDVAGASGGSSLSSGSSAQLGEQDNTSSFADSYADKQIELQQTAIKWNAVSTIGGLAANIASIGASATQIFDTLSTLPSRRRLGNVQANIAEQTQADVIKSIGAGTTSNILDNVSSNIGILSSLSTLVGPDATDEDMTRTFTSLGMPSDSIPQYVSGVNEFRKNPNVKSYYANGQKQLNETEAFNQHYTSDVLGRMIANDIKMRDLDFTLGIQAQQFQKSVNDYFMTEKNAKNTAILQSTSLDSGIAQNVTDVAKYDLMRKQIKHDVEAFSRSIEHTAEIYNESKQVCADILKKVSAEGRTPTAAERAILDSEYAKQVQLMGLGSQSLAMQYSFLQHTYMNRYQADAIIKDSGNLRMNTFTNPQHTFMANTFSFADIVNGQANATGIGASLLEGLIKFGSSAVTKRIPAAGAITKSTK